MGPIGSPEPFVQNYLLALRNIPEERRSQAFGSLFRQVIAQEWKLEISKNVRALSSHLQ
jgi:hypothetical protein